MTATLRIRWGHADLEQIGFADREDVAISFLLEVYPKLGAERKYIFLTDSPRLLLQSVDDVVQPSSPLGFISAAHCACARQSQLRQRDVHIDSTHWHASQSSSSLAQHVKHGGRIVVHHAGRARVRHAAWCWRRECGQVPLRRVGGGCRCRHGRCWCVSKYW